MVITLYRLSRGNNTSASMNPRSDGSQPVNLSTEYIRASPQTITPPCIVGFLLTQEKGLPQRYHYNKLIPVVVKDESAVVPVCPCVTLSYELIC